MIWLMTVIPVNRKARIAIKRKSVGIQRKRTRQTHRQAIQIGWATVNIDASDAKRRDARKGIP